jgi:hypothetical protein
LATVAAGVSNGVPDLTNAVAIALPNPADFSAFGTMLGETIFPPVVGDAQMELALTYTQATGALAANASAPMNSGATTAAGLIFGLEDNYGWIGAGQNLFQVSYTDSSNVSHNIDSITSSGGTLNVNFIFSDSQLVTWVTGSVNSSGVFNGTFLYRMVQSGDTECQNESISCNSSEYNCTGYDNMQNYNAYVACIDYLSGMTTVGTFSQTFSTWVTVQ